jgi:hypothetical protein
MRRYQDEKNHPNQVSSRDWIIDSQAVKRFKQIHCERAAEIDVPTLAASGPKILMQ